MKRWSVVLSGLLAAVLLVSCSRHAPIQEPVSASQEDVELEFWTFPVGDWGNPTTVSNIISGFHKAHPNIHISVTFLDYDTGDSIINEAAAQGRTPDLVLEGPERLVASWGEKGWMADLSDLWQSERADAVYENIRTACRHSSGAYYEFPICMSAHCMAINYDLFRDAGALAYLDEETHTWTTQGFIQAVQALAAYGQTQVGTVYCKNQSGDQGTRALVTNLYGGTFTDDSHSSYTVDSAENRQALALLCELEGITIEPELTATDAINAFCRRETAMCFCWNAAIEVQQTINNPDLDFEVFPMAFPTDGGAPRLEGGIWGLGVFDNGSEARIEAAKTFIRWITENEAAYSKAVLASSYWPVWEMDNLYENDMVMTEYSIFTPYMGGYYQVTPGWTQAREAWWKLLAKIAAGADIEEAVKDFPFSD